MRLDIGLDEGQAWRAVFDDTGDGLAVGLASAVAMEVSRLLSCAPSSLVEGEVLRRYAKVVAKGRHSVFICSVYPLGELISGREEVGGGGMLANSDKTSKRGQWAPQKKLKTKKSRPICPTLLSYA